MRNNFLKQTLKGTKWYMIAILLFSIVYSRLIVYVPMFIKYALDGVIMEQKNVVPWYIHNLFYADDKISKIIILVLVLIIVNLLILLVSYLKNKVNTKFNLKINQNVKVLILKHIPRLEYMEFSNIDKSNVIQRVNNDATTYAEFFNSQINLFFDTAFIVIFAIAQTLQLNFIIGIFIMVICLLIILLSIWYFKVSKPLVEDIVEMNKQVIHKTTVSIEESKMLKIFNRANKEKEEFKKMNQEYKAKDVKLAKMKVWYIIGTHTLRNFKEPFILLFGGILVVNGDLSLAAIAVLLTYATQILGYLYETVNKMANVNEFRVAYKKLNELMKYKEEIDEKPEVVLNGDIVFQDVSIKIKENCILKNLNFTIKQGENVAIIGDNGSGKTIIAKTLIGFYEYTGNIYIGENNIKEVSKKSIRNYIGIILQDTYLFTDTIHNNINMIQKEVTNQEIIQICKLADIYEDIKTFDGNIEYMVGKGGNNISGGQKQRVAIARTLLLDNKIIVFDDSLSKLDTKTKLTILNNIIEMNKGTIIISHDVEVVKKCDKVLFIHDNQIEVGSHDTFLAKSDAYRELIQISQNKILEEEEA